MSKNYIQLQQHSDLKDDCGADLEINSFNYSKEKKELKEALSIIDDHYLGPLNEASSHSPAFIDCNNKASSDDNSDLVGTSNLNSSAEREPWKTVKIYSPSELASLSIEDLRDVLENLHDACQAASLRLVSSLQCRHTLHEEAELRNVAIEQLLRRAEKFSTVWSSPPSPLMAGRG